MKKNWKRIGLKILPSFLMIVFTFFIMRYSIVNQSFIGGLDTNFHMNIFYEAARQIATGHYSYFMSLYGFNQSGRIVNALYGPVFSYLGGLWLLITHSWVRFQISLLIIIILASGLGMDLLARKARVNYWVSIVLAFLYMLSHPIITGWLGNSEFTGLGAAILPFIILVGIDIVQKRRIKVLSLAVAMAIILQIHLMTSVIVALSLVPFVIAGLIMSNHRIKMLMNGILSTIIGVLLTGNIWGAIYDVYSSNHLIPTFPVFHMQSFNNALTNHYWDLLIPAGKIILIMIIIYVIFQWKKMKALDWTLLVDGLGFLWLSSAYFPWDHLWHIWPKISSIIQFPTRFLPVAIVLMLILLGRVATKIWTLPIKPSRTVMIRMGLGVILLLILAINVRPNLSYVRWASATTWDRPYVVRYSGISDYRHNGPKLRRAYQDHNLYDGLTVINKITADYLPTPKPITPKQYYSAPIYHNFARDYIHDSVHFKRRVGNHQLNLSWKLPSQRVNKSGRLVKTNRHVIIPAVDYGHSLVYLNGRQIHPHKTLVGAIKLRVKPEREDHLKISYHPSKVFKLASAFTIISWAVILIYAFIILRKKKVA